MCAGSAKAAELHGVADCQTECQAATRRTDLAGSSVQTGSLILVTPAGSWVVTAAAAAAAAAAAGAELLG
jgi:hypothetical protein